MGRDGPNNFYYKIKGKKNTHITYYEMGNTEPLLQSIGSKFYRFIQSAFDSGLFYILKPLPKQVAAKRALYFDRKFEI